MVPGPRPACAYFVIFFLFHPFARTILQPIPVILCTGLFRCLFYKAAGESQSASNGSNAAITKTRIAVLAFIGGAQGKDSRCAHALERPQAAKQILLGVKFNVLVVGCWIQVVAELHKVAINFPVVGADNVTIVVF